MPTRRAFVAAAASVVAFAGLPARIRGQGGNQRPTRRRVLVLDVIETMLDLKALEPHFERVFADRAVLREWFSNLLLYSNVSTLAGPYAEFGAIAGAALSMVAEARGVRVAPDDRERILSGTASLPAHPDVRPALERLRNEGFRLVTLTNSAPPAVAQQLRNAGLADLFERSFSVDTVKRFKPAPDAYRYVAQELKVSTGDLRLVAAHAWDIVGALQVGCVAAFIARPGAVLYPLGPQPDIVARTCNRQQNRSSRAMLDQPSL